MVIYRNGQIKASEVFNSQFGLIKVITSADKYNCMSVVMQKTNIGKCTEKQKKAGA